MKKYLILILAPLEILILAIVLHEGYYNSRAVSNVRSCVSLPAQPICLGSSCTYFDTKYCRLSNTSDMKKTWIMKYGIEGIGSILNTINKCDRYPLSQFCQDDNNN